MATKFHFVILALFLLVKCGKAVEGNSEVYEPAAWFNEKEYKDQAKMELLQPTNDMSENENMDDGSNKKTAALSVNGLSSAVAGIKAKNPFKKQEKCGGPDKLPAKPPTFNPWKNATVYMTIDKKFNETERLMILKGICHIELNSCVRFVNNVKKDGDGSGNNGPSGSTAAAPAQISKNYIKFQQVEENVCSSQVGMVGGEQIIKLPRWNRNTCWEQVGPGVHEMLHAIGFYHEHARPDRAGFVDIRFENLKDCIRDQHNFRTNFAVAPNLMGKYDFASIMHYSGRSGFGKASKIIIEAKDPKFQQVMGNRRKMSKIDIQKLNLWNECEGRQKRKTRCTKDI